MQTVNYNYTFKPDSDAFNRIWVDFNGGYIYLQFNNGSLVGRVLTEHIQTVEGVDGIESWGHYWHDTLKHAEASPELENGVEFVYAVPEDSGFNAMLTGDGAISGGSVKHDSLTSDPLIVNNSINASMLTTGVLDSKIEVTDEIVDLFLDVFEDNLLEVDDREAARTALVAVFSMLYLGHIPAEITQNEGSDVVDAEDFEPDFTDSELSESEPYGDDEGSDDEPVGDSTISVTLYNVAPGDRTAVFVTLDETINFFRERNIGYEAAIISSYTDGRA